MFSWYPTDRFELEKEVTSLLRQKLSVKTPKSLNGVVSPHAGYQYSGKIAGQAYALLRNYYLDKKLDPNIAVIIGPSHKMVFKGAITFSQKFFRTPLGELKIAKSEFDGTEIEREHSIENQMPFLQVLGFQEVVPIMVGGIDWTQAAEIAKKIAKINAPYIFSTDLSHFSNYNEAVEKDKKSLHLIENLDKKYFNEVDACGLTPLMVLTELCKIKKTQPKTLGYENSGDVTGIKTGVVGYASMYF